MANKTYRAPAGPPKRQRTKAQQQVTNRTIAKYGIPRYTKSFGRQPFPPTLQSQLKYAEVIDLSLVNGFGTARFRANSMFDPNMATGGHQPMYFDQLMDLYNHYTVMNARIKVTQLGPNISSGGDRDGFLALVLDDDGSYSWSTPQQPIEARLSTWCPWNNNGSGPGSLTGSYDAERFYGAAAMANDQLKGNSSADVLEQMVWHIFGYDANLGTGSAYVMVEIEYNCVFDELKTQSGS